MLLLVACLIWVLPKSRSWCLRISPVFTFYSIGLLLLEFIYGLNLTDAELPEFKQIGLVEHQVPFVHLCVKAALLSTFWLTLRQFITERRKERARLNISPELGVTSPGSNSMLDASTMQTTFLNMFHSMLVKYWIFLSSGMLLLMSCQNQVVAYRIVYMILFLYFITAFQLVNTFWRKSLFVFHLVVIIYSMMVLLLIYIFQFDGVTDYFQELLHIDEEVMQAIGFVRFDKKDELALRLLTPCTFLIINILQIHYFSKPWIELTETRASSSTSRGLLNQATDDTATVTGHEHKLSDIIKKPQTNEKFKDFVKRMFENVSIIYSIVSVYLWRAAEIHIYKIIVLTIAIVTLHQISLINFLLFVATLLGLIADRFYAIEKRARSIFSGMVQVYVCLITIVSMIYQLNFIESPFISNCTVSSARFRSFGLLRT